MSQSPKLREMKDRLVVIESLMRIFRAERYSSLIGMFSAVAVIVFLGGKMVVEGNRDIQSYIAIFGASGLIGVSNSRIFFFFDKVMRLVDLRGAAASTQRASRTKKSVEEDSK